VVEGFCAKSNQCIGNFIRIAQHVLRWNAQNGDALVLQPFSSPLVALRSIAQIMCRAVDFDRQLRRRTIEIEHIFADWMLTPELQVTASDSDPQKLLRQRELASQTPRILVGPVARAHR
jgi:hypothetical protein